MVLYVDILFAINFSMDFLALFICSIIFHKKVYKFRIIISSTIGATYGVLQQINKFNLFFNILLCVATAMIMCKIAYKEKKLYRYLSLCLMYSFVSATLGGVMSLIYSFFNRVMSEIIINNSNNVPYEKARSFIVILITGIISIICSRILINKKSITETEINISILDGEYVLRGLIDSGNTLKDPLSGKYVILVSKQSNIGKRIERVDEIKKRFIPYKDVNGEGLLKGVIAKKIIIDGKELDGVIAPVENKNFNGYDALIPGALI